MPGISEYILSVSCAAVISAVVLRLLDGKGSAATMGKILTGVFVMLTVIAPITQVRVSDLTQWLPDISDPAQQAVSVGQAAGKNALKENISNRLETYILNKAAQLGASISVRIELSDDAMPIPVCIYLQGDVSPYVKTRLQEVIRSDLGLDKEYQIWK